MKKIKHFQNSWYQESEFPFFYVAFSPPNYILNHFPAMLHEFFLPTPWPISMNNWVEGPADPHPGRERMG